jgi:large subunit ribosomal protein L17
MLANMAASLILHKRIKTTTAKAKALRGFVEPLITKSKDDSTHSRRVVFSYLQDKEAVSELFREISPKIINRPGGYTRILKTGTRLGDNAEMCVIELVDYNENLLAAGEETQSRSGRRRRRGGKKKSEGEQPQASALQAEDVTAADDGKEEAVQEPEAIDQEEKSPVETTAKQEGSVGKVDEKTEAEVDQKSVAADETVKEEAVSEKPAEDESPAEKTETPPEKTDEGKAAEAGTDEGKEMEKKAEDKKEDSKAEDEKKEGSENDTDNEKKE